MRKAVSVVGFKNTGKTTLMLDLIRELSARGHDVAAVKFTDHGFDLAQTDTAQFAEECVSVAGIGRESTTLFWNQSRNLQELLPLLAADIVLVEGGKSLTWLPRIVLLGSGEDESALGNELALATWGPGRLEYVPVAASIAELATLVEKRGFVLPGLDCGACGRSACLELAREIVTGTAQTDACQAMHPRLHVRVGGQNLTLGPFVERLLASTLRGFLAELKGSAPDQRVEIILDEDFRSTKP